MSKKLLFNFNRDVIQNYTYVEYVGAIITATNTLEKPIKSAILKGQTLVNIADVSTMAAYNGASILDGTIILDRSRNNSLVQITSANKLIQSGKKYIAILNEINGNTQGVILKVQHASYTERVDFVNNRAIFIADTYGEVNRWVFVESTRLGSDAGTTSFKWSIIEYQEGMENWDIPYFTGMQSVKLPVLTTSNEDGTKTNILTVNEDVTLRSNGDICDELTLLTGQLTQRIGEDGAVLSKEAIKTVDLSILDQNGNKVSSISSFNDTTHIKASSETIPPIFKGYLATKEVE